MTLGNPAPKRARWVLVSLVVLSILFVGGIGLSVSYTDARRAQAQTVAAQAQQRKSSQQSEDATAGNGDP